MPAAPDDPTTTATLQTLRPHAPFGALDAAELERIVQSAQPRRFGSGEAIVQPSPDRPSHCYIVLEGRVRGERPAPPGAEGTSWDLEAGDLFPLGALVASRGSGSVYRAVGNALCLALPIAVFDDLLARSAVFRDFCTRRLGHLFDLSRANLQAAYAAEMTGRADFALPVGKLVHRAPVTVSGDTTLGTALRIMEDQGIGALPVVADDRRPVGIFTRQDVIGRVVLPQRGLDTPMREVMTHPVHVLAADASAMEATLLAARHGVRHIVVVDGDGRVEGVVSERDLYALSRRSARGIHSAIRRAPDVSALARCASDIRALSRALVAQGVASGPLTRMISGLNDQLTARLLDIVAPGFDLAGLTVCWIGMGSEGRNEQTIATDQDNGLIFAETGAGTDPAAARARLIPFARAVNDALDRCGYPLCKGDVMARNPRWCRSLPEWRSAFARWIDSGDPGSMLASLISFDFRALWGDASLAAELRADVAVRAQANPRFLKQLTDEALRNRPPLNWRGGLDARADADGVDGVDLKLAGTTPFVDAARVFALASGVTVTNTVERLARAAAPLNLPRDEVRAWSDAFEFLQLLRLRTQHRGSGVAARAGANPNFVPLRDLSELDRRIVTEALRQARRLQQRLELDVARR
jgi:CBS domain-containing protein